MSCPFCNGVKNTGPSNAMRGRKSNGLNVLNPPEANTTVFLKAHYTGGRGTLISVVPKLVYGVKSPGELMVLAADDYHARPTFFDLFDDAEYIKYASWAEDNNHTPVESISEEDTEEQE